MKFSLRFQLYSLSKYSVSCFFCLFFGHILPLELQPCGHGNNNFGKGLYSLSKYAVKFNSVSVEAMRKIFKHIFTLHDRCGPVLKSKALPSIYEMHNLGRGLNNFSY